MTSNDTALRLSFFDLSLLWASVVKLPDELPLNAAITVSKSAFSTSTRNCPSNGAFHLYQTVCLLMYFCARNSEMSPMASTVDPLILPLVPISSFALEKSSLS